MALQICDITWRSKGSLHCTTTGLHRSDVLNQDALGSSILTSIIG